MNDAWLKADLETAQMVLSRIEHEDIPKLKRLLERIATIRGVEVEDFSSNIDENLTLVPTPKSTRRVTMTIHPGESVQTWHEDKGPEWPEEEE